MNSRLEVVDFVAFLPEGNIEVARFSGLVLAPGIFAARMSSQLSWAQLSRDLRVFRVAQKYLPVSLNYADSYSGWALFTAQGADPGFAWQNNAYQIPVEFLLRFKDVSPTEVRMESAVFRERLSRSDRNVASLGRLDIIQRDLIRTENEILTDIADPRNQMSMEGLAIGPRIRGARCEFGVTRFDTPALRANIVSSTTVACSAGTIRTDITDVGVSLTAGVLRLKNGVQISEQLRAEILEEVSRQEFIIHEELSFQTDNSSRAECGRAKIQLNFLEGRYCTRNILAVRDFQDTVTALGRFAGDRFVYTVVRTKSMTPNATVQLVGAIINQLGQAANE